MLNGLVARFRRTNSAVSPVNENGDNVVKTEEEEKNDHQWDRPIEFLLSLISNSVGLGNVWRFPYLAAQSGGGAFLIPYFTLYFLIGAPLYFMELALGQFTSRGPATGFVHARGWRGIGIAMIINSLLGALYYNVIIAWALFYFILSFRSKLLWSECGNWWNTADRCFEPGSANNLFTANDTTWNCTAAQFANFTLNNCQEINITTKVTATEEFFYRLLLNKSASFDDFGTPGLYMSLLLLVAWLIICLCTIRGVQSTGKVAYFTAIFPYIVLLVLIIFTATLDGAVDGIKFYVIPRWELIGDFKIWQAAASQVFFSLGISFGSLIAYSAANRFNNNFYKQMCIVVSCDCFTGVFAGFAVFATIGFLAKSLGADVAEYAQASGPGLAFITYPEALSKMPASPFFSVIFFLMLLALGLGSQFASTDVPITALMEFFPAFAKKRYIFVIGLCTVFYLCSLPFACPGGIYLFEIFQEYTANISLVFMGFFEVISIAYFYGFNRFMNDVKMMLGKRAAEYYLFVTWCITAPLLSLILTVSNLLNAEPLVNQAGAGFETYRYPTWSIALGWIIFIICILPIPVFFVLTYLQGYRKLKAERLAYLALNRRDDGVDNDYTQTPLYIEALRLNNTPAETWGPRQRANQVGPYAHLNRAAPRDDIVFDRRSPTAYPRLGSQPDIKTGTNNPTFDRSSLDNNDDNNGDSQF